MNNDVLFNSAVSHLDMPRSRFLRNCSHKVTFNEGELVPIFIDEVLPGDTYDMDTNSLVRMSTLLTPIMDDLFLDIYYFFVPNRLVWTHFNEFMGENTESAWIPTTEYTIPQIEAPTGGWNVHTIADRIGVPTGIDGISVNALPFRAFALIYNEWFRDQNIMDPVIFNKDETTVTGVNTGNYITDIALGGLCPKVTKFRDYFTSCLPGPQKGPSVEVPLSGSGQVVVNNNDFGDIKWNQNVSHLYSHSNQFENYPFIYYKADNSVNGYAYLDTETNKFYKSEDFTNNKYLSLGVDLENTPLVSVNQLRIAFQLQKFYETQARSGSRYTEIIKAFFGVDSPDARLQRPEYLAGDRIRININQVVQTSGSQSGSTAQGNTTAYSLTFSKDSSFVKSFTEHGFIIGLACVRHHHTYQNGIERFWSRKTREDFYFPVFANIGEQPILNKEIFASGNSTDDEVFGYQEAWADYRYKPSRVSGEFRSSYSQSLDSWHLADDFNSLPTLSSDFIQEDYNTLDRTLAVTSSNSNQFIADFYFNLKVSRCMPLYSVPGLIDHH